MRLTSANHREVLASARSRKKSDIEQIVARLSPRPDVETAVRKLPVPRLDAIAPAEPAVSPSLPALDPTTVPTTCAASTLSHPSAPPPSVVAAAVPSPAPRAAVTPLSPDRYKLTLTIGGDTLERLRLAKDMLGHAIPSGDDAAVLDRALTVLLADLARKKFADTPKPRPANGNETRRRIKTRTRHVTPAVKRVVWVRDLGRCAFIGATGHRCNERRFVEFHHLDPVALGGEASVDQIELRCRRHNDYEGRLYFGRRRRNVTGVVRDAGVVLEATTSRGRQSEFAGFGSASSFRNEFPSGKPDDGRPGTPPKQT